MKIYEFHLRFVPWVQINNIPSLVQIMAWHQAGDKPLSEPMMVKFVTQHGQSCSANDFSAVYCQAISWTNADIKVKFESKY